MKSSPAYLQLVISLIVLAPRTNVAAQDQWKVVYQLRSKDSWVSAAYADEGRDWIAAGKNVVVWGLGNAPEEVPLDGVMMGTFGVDADGTLFAAGSHGSIWKRVGPKQWQLEHQSRAPGTRGKVPHQEQLVLLQRIHDGERQVFMTYGVPGAVYIRSPTGWGTASDDVAERLRHAAIARPDLHVPAKCRPMLWLPFSHGGGFVQCINGHAFVERSGSMIPLGKLPTRCHHVLSSAVLSDQIFVTCDDDGRLWRFTAGKWAPVAGVRSVWALSANDQCIVAAADRTVLQYCIDPKPKLRSGNETPTRQQMPLDKMRGEHCGQQSADARPAPIISNPSDAMRLPLGRTLLAVAGATAPTVQAGD